MYRTELRVAEGGIFHTRKVKYSPETHAFLKDLIKESKISMAYRKQIQDCLKNGEPLPTPQKKTNSKMVIKNDDNVIRNPSARKRSLEEIKKLAANSLDSFTPPRNLVDHQKEKERLQSLMAYGKVLPPENLTVKVKPNRQRPSKSRLDSPQLIRQEMANQIIDEVKERLKFLNEMEAIGEGKNYRHIIMNEVEEKIQDLKMIDIELYRELSDTIAQHIPMRNFKITTLSNTILNPS